MRITVEILLDRDRIDKDKNRTILHILKLLMEKSSNDMYRKLYEENIAKTKDLNFSVYMGRGAKFLRDEILVPSQKLLVNFSTYDPGVSIALYNSFVEFRGLEIPIKDNVFNIGKIILHEAKPITSNRIKFKTASPIVVREHRGDNKKTYYHDLSTSEGQEVFKLNLRYQIRDKFPEVEEESLDSIGVRVLETRLTLVKFYNIVIPSNLATIEIATEPYILDYLYLSGIGSKKSSGFGFVNIVD